MDFEKTLIGHRGAAGLAPENTIASIKQALYCKVAFIEVDVQVTLDKQFVLMHDRTVKRTTNGVGKVSALNLMDLKQLDAGSYFSPDFKNERIPTLEEALVLIRDSQAKVIIEIKDFGRWDKALLDSLVRLIKRLVAVENTYIVSFNRKHILYIIRFHPYIKYGYLSIIPPKSNNLLLMSASFISIYWASMFFYRNRINSLQERGLPVWAWTVNSSNRILWLLGQGFDGVETDYPNMEEIRYEKIDK